MRIRALNGEGRMLASQPIAQLQQISPTHHNSNIKMFALLVFTALIAFADGNCEFCSSGITNDTLILPDFLNLPEFLSSCANLTTMQV